jgi:hypothetical protein
MESFNVMRPTSSFSSALVEVGGRVVAEIMDQPELAATYAARFATFEAGLGGDVFCPVCHIKFGKESKLSAVKHDCCDDSINYDCSICRTRYRLAS